MRRTFLPLLTGLVFACAAPRPAAAQTTAGPRSFSIDPLGTASAEAAQRFALPATWIRAIVRAESNSNPRATSPKGAIGLMQLMPATWSKLRLVHGLGGDPYDPHDNIIAGSAYIRTLFDRYGTPGWIAAYNAGPARYEAWLRGRPLPSETRAYVATVAPNLAEGGILQRARTAIILRIDWTRSPLFVAQQRDAAAATPLPRERMPSEAAKPPISGADPAKAPRSNGLFVARGDQGTRP